MLPFARMDEFQFIKIQIILSISMYVSVINWWWTSYISHLYVINSPKHNIAYLAHKSTVLVVLHEDGFYLLMWLDLNVEDSLSRYITNGQKVGAGSLPTVVCQDCGFSPCGFLHRLLGLPLMWWLSSKSNHMQEQCYLWKWWVWACPQVLQGSLQWPQWFCLEFQKKYGIWTNPRRAAE